MKGSGAPDWDAFGSEAPEWGARETNALGLRRANGTRSLTGENGDATRKKVGVARTQIAPGQVLGIGYNQASRVVDGASNGGCARYDRRFLIAHSEEHFYGFFGNDASLGMAPEARRAISRFRGVVDAGSVFLDFRGT